MKKLFTAVCLFILAHSLNAADYIAIGDMRFFKAYESPAADVKIREYLPKGEKLERWNRMVTVQLHKNLKNPEDALKQIAGFVKKSNPAAHAELLKNEQTGDVLLDFIVFAPPGTPEHYSEWNMMRGKYVEGAGLILYLYAMRIYSVTESNVDKAITLIREERTKMMPLFIKASFEEQKEPDKAPAKQNQKK